MSGTGEFLKLVKENPDLPIVPMVDYEVCGDDSCTWWMGNWGKSEVTEYYLGEERVHFRDDDEENVLADMAGCKYYSTKEGKDITELSDKEWDELYASIPWIKCIVVYIGT